MAESLAHKWGQIIGELLEASVHSMLQPIASSHKLYLDSKGDRAARTGKKVRWKDQYGNFHDLDYVLERGGTETTLGVPAAFIEIAWRRYTKHSKNKAQEIEGALLPLKDTYSHLHPFVGAVLAGEFTGSALDQLRSRNFRIIHFPIQGIYRAFQSIGIDASFDEDTDESEFKRKIAEWNRASVDQIKVVRSGLIDAEKAQVDAFIVALKASLSRNVTGVMVTVLHGSPASWSTVLDAIAYINSYSGLDAVSGSVAQYEIDVRYSNGDNIHAVLREKDDAIRFLRSYL